MNTYTALTLTGSFACSQTREALFCLLCLTVILLLIVGRIVLDGIEAHNLLQDAGMGRRRIRQGVGLIASAECTE